MIIIKEGPGNFSCGRIPHWMNHIYLCLYCIVYIMCFILLLRDLVFIKTGIREKGNSQEK
jgi:hypothetical protein